MFTIEALGAQIYFAHEQILMFASEINATSHKLLGYRTPEDLFEKHLDRIYAVNG